MAEPAQQSKGRIRRWLDKRREAQRRGAEMSHRAKAARKADAERLRRGGPMGGGDSPGPFGGM
jgi:hypothetical protein